MSSRTSCTPSSQINLSLSQQEGARLLLGSVPAASIAQKVSERPRNASSLDVFIVGVGPAGLTATDCLTKEASSVLVVEKDPDHIGGICRTINHHGFLFDVGGHRFFSKSKEIIEMCPQALRAKKNRGRYEHDYSQRNRARPALAVAEQIDAEME